MSAPIPEGISLSEETPQKEVVRTDSGQFKKGVSGNPVGRPKGSKNQITLLRQSLELQLREESSPEMAEVLRTAIALAKAGDRSMIKLLLELHMTKSAPEGGDKADRAVINIFGPKEDNIKDVTPEILEGEYVDNSGDTKGTEVPE